MRWQNIIQGKKMNIFNVILIGLALAMDACGVAISIGLNCHVKKIGKVYFTLSFAFFQFLFSFIGSFVGKFVNSKIIAVPSILGGIAIFIVGIMMIKEGMEDKEECILVKPIMYLIIGISVSIDAMVLGFTALYTRGDLIFYDALLVGLITLVLVVIAFLLSGFLKKAPFVTKYSDYLGGVILILFSIKMLLL